VVEIGAARHLLLPALPDFRLFFCSSETR
jgi:hypothetical protein